MASPLTHAALLSFASFFSRVSNLLERIIWGIVAVGWALRGVPVPVNGFSVVWAAIDVIFTFF